MSDEKIHPVDVPLAPGERSFLIQPEKKSLLARMPSIFSGPLQSPTNDQGSMYEQQQSAEKFNPSNSNTTFKQGAFNRRSHSMAAPLMISPSSVGNPEHLDVFSVSGRILEDDQSRQKLENYKTML